MVAKGRVALLVVEVYRSLKAVILRMYCLAVKFPGSSFGGEN